MSCFKRFPKGKFPDKILFKDNISKTDYLRALKVWKVFKIKNMVEYHNLYLKTDVLLLADVFEKFIKTCLKYYKFDPLHYFSSPELSWDAMFKMIGVELELISDMTFIILLKKGWVVGFHTFLRFTRANNKYMKNYDLGNRVNISLILMQIICMAREWISIFLNDKFKWMENFDNFDVNSISKSSSTGYILKVDLGYAKELHELHNDYPLAPEKLKITQDSQNIAKNC